MFMQEIAVSSFNVEEVMPPGGSRTKTLGKDAPGLALAGVDGKKDGHQGPARKNFALVRLGHVVCALPGYVHHCEDRVSGHWFLRQD
jgi:hypothetical protein